MAHVIKIFGCKTTDNPNTEIIGDFNKTLLAKDRSSRQKLNNQTPYSKWTQHYRLI